MSERTILLVEDDENQVLLALRALRKHGIVKEVDEMVVARDGEEALDYIFGTGSHAGRDTSVMPEFVLLDLKLPKMDGLQVLERLRGDERTELLPVILFSSSREHEDVVAGYRLGANSYVAKPANFEKFSEAMQYLGWYWLSFNESPTNYDHPDPN
jgi:two-component system response regulator